MTRMKKNCRHMLEAVSNGRQRGAHHTCVPRRIRLSGRDTIFAVVVGLGGRSVELLGIGGALGIEGCVAKSCVLGEDAQVVGVAV
jgi:hypothetical protein